MVQPIVPVDADLLATLADILASGKLTNHGPWVQRLEAGLGAWLGGPVAAVASGSAGLQLGLAALDLHATGARCKAAILPSFTYVATANAVAQAGFVPVLCDVDPNTWTLCPRALEAVLAARDDVAVVVPVAVYGVAPDLAALAALARGAGAALVYDAAHALGTEVLRARLAAQVDVQVFSLHATKVLPAVEGGLVWARDPAVLQRIQALRCHGIGPDPFAVAIGLNAKLSELHAAVGHHSLLRLDTILANRRAYGARLTQAAGRSRAFRVQAVPTGMRSNYQNFGLRVAIDQPHDIETVVAAFAREGVEARRYFWPPLHQLRRFAHDQAHLPVTRALVSELLCLPLHSWMDEPSLCRVEAALAAVARSLA